MRDHGLEDSTMCLRVLGINSVLSKMSVVTRYNDQVMLAFSSVCILACSPKARRAQGSIKLSEPTLGVNEPASRHRGLEVKIVGYVVDAGASIGRRHPRFWAALL